jgi:hypothetical protein
MYYIESSRDGVGGESQLCSYKDYADAIDLLINDPEARKKYGINGRRHINKEYKWCDIADKLVSIINTVMNKHVSQDVKKSDETSITLDDIQDAITDLTVTENEENLKTNDEKTLDVKSDVHKQTLKLSSSGEEKKVENQKPKEVSSDKNKKVVLTSRAQKILKAKKSSKKRQS